MKQVGVEKNIIGLAIGLEPALTISQLKNNIKEFKNRLKGSSPQEIGKRVSDHYIETPHTNFKWLVPPFVIRYTETFTWYSALTFAKQHK